MKLLLLTLLTTATLAQQPDAGQPNAAQPDAARPSAGFSRKQKTIAPTPGLAERLQAQVMPIPKNGAGRSSLTAAGGVPVSAQPLRLRVVRDSATGLPVYIERKPSRVTHAQAGARLSTAAAASATYQFLGQVRGLLKVGSPEAQFAVSRSETDDLGQTHVRLTQQYAGVPVHGSELVAHLTNGEVTLLNGRYQSLPTGVSTTPKLDVAHAVEVARTDLRQRTTVRSFGDKLLRMAPAEGELCVYSDQGNFKLAYQLTVRPNFRERWEYIVDAQTGAVLDKFNNTCSFTGPIKASGRDLNGKTQTFQTYQQGNGYFLIDASRPMFNAGTSKMPGDPVGAIWTVDARNTFGDSLEVYQNTSASNTDWKATAISAHYNAGVAYDYYRTVFKRNSLNGSGGTMVSIINVADDDGKPLDNAYWNGKFMFYGNGNPRYFKPLAGGLDVAGHEMTHGVIQNTANLPNRGQSGALNESLADAFAMMIDRDDWTIGEDVVNPQFYTSGALRSMSNPNASGPTDPSYQPKTMAQYDNTTEDNGGVHTNNGIPNHAFYLFATAVSKEKAEQVYYRALTTYLVRTSQFLDLRLAIIRAAGDLYGATGTEVTAAKNAFDAVGIVEGTLTTPGKQPDLPVAAGQDLLLLTSTDDLKLYSTNVGVTPAKFDLKSTSTLLHRPSVTDDGKFAYYVSADKRIRSVNLTGTPTETVISNETIWDNVAVSKDGTKLAALTAEKDGSVYVYSYALKKWTKFRLYNPTNTEGVTTGEVQYADSFEWDFAGENIVYDAFNAVTTADGDDIEYWDVGFINVWNNKAATFAKGTIEKLFSDLEPGESVGNPSYAKNSPDVIAFDYVNEDDNSYYVVATDLSKGDLQGVYENNTLGFPSYSRQDNRLVFSTKTGSREDIASIGVGADKLTPSGTASVLYQKAKWPVWYTQATRTLPTKTAQTITFGSIADRYANQGNLTLRATSSSGLPVSFQVRSGPASLTGSTMRFSGAGMVTVRAYHDGNEQFAAATPVDRTFAVLVVTGLEPTWSDALSVYPNPARTLLTVELPGTETIESVTLSTATGAGVLQPSVRARQHTATLEMGHLLKGLYFLRIQTPSGTVHRKVLKE